MGNENEDQDASTSVRLLWFIPGIIATIALIAYLTMRLLEYFPLSDYPAIPPVF